MNGSNDNFAQDDGGFDALLRSAMTARPEPFAPTNLAARAMEFARAELAVAAARRSQFLARQRRWAQVTALAATLLIAAMIAFAVGKMQSRGDLSYLLSSSTTTASTDSAATATSDASISADTSTSSATTTETTTLGISSSAVVICVAGLLVMGMVLITVSRGTTPDSWGPDAAAGVW